MRIHQRYAQLLSEADRSGSAAVRAYHSLASHDLPAAFAASLEAANDAARLAAPADELRRLETVLELWSATPDARTVAGASEAMVTLRASNAAIQAGESNKALMLNREALRRATELGDDELRGRVQSTLASNLISVDRDEAAYAESRRALALIPQSPVSEARIWALSIHILAANYVGKFEEARELLPEALAGARELGLVDAEADLLIHVVRFSNNGRDTEEGRAELEHARDLAERSQNPTVQLRVLFNLAIGRFEVADLAAVAPYVEAGKHIAAARGLTAWNYAVELERIGQLTDLMQGNWDRFSAGPALTAHTGRRLSSVPLQVRAARGGDARADADPIIEQTLAESRNGSSIDDQVGSFWNPMVGAAVSALEQAHWERDPDYSESLFARISDHSYNGSSHPGMIRIAALAVSTLSDRIGDDRALGRADEVARRFKDVQQMVSVGHAAADDLVADEGKIGPEGSAWLGRLNAEFSRASDLAGSVGAWEEVVDAFGYGDEYELARSRYRLAEALLAAGRHEDAAQQVTLARTTAAVLKAAPLMTALDRLIVRARLKPSGVEPGLLTRRELDVLPLLAAGRTNQQIASELFISAKTASVHVSNILAKLGATSRTHAAAIARERGLIQDPLHPN